MPPLANSSRTSASHRQQPLINQFNEEEEEALSVWAGMVLKLGKRAAWTGQGWVGAGHDWRVDMPQFTSLLSQDGKSCISLESLWKEKVNQAGLRGRE